MIITLTSAPYLEESNFRVINILSADLISTLFHMQSCIHSVDQALECCNSIGYPVMLKASWGGGGKGIRKCMNEDDVRNSLKQVLALQTLHD